MKRSAGEIAFTTDYVLMSEDGKPLICHDNSPNRPREQSAANRAHLCLCWNTHDELVHELQEVLSWALVEKAALRQQEINSIRAVISKATGVKQ